MCNLLLSMLHSRESLGVVSDTMQACHFLRDVGDGQREEVLSCQSSHPGESGFLHLQPYLWLPKYFLRMCLVTPRTFLVFAAFLLTMWCSISFHATEWTFCPLPTCSSIIGFHCIVHRRLLSRGVRYGEALHPGPCSESYTTIAIINPTAIHGKEESFQELQDTWGVHTFACAETTATTTVQQQFSRTLHKQGLRSVWSAPVQEQRERVNNVPSLRGKAGGTSLHSSWPLTGRHGILINHMVKLIPGWFTVLSKLVLFGSR